MQIRVVILTGETIHSSHFGIRHHQLHTRTRIDFTTYTIRETDIENETMQLCKTRARYGSQHALTPARPHELPHRTDLFVTWQSTVALYRRPFIGDSLSATY